MKFIIIHGALSSSQENWFPYLRKKLAGWGNEVIVPDFPTPQGQDLDNWMHFFNRRIKNVDDQTVLIGHSLGCAFILSVLERLNVKVKACYLVSGFVGPLGIDYDKINKSFAEKSFNWEKIKKNCSKFVLFHSKNDEFVPLAKGEELKEKLGAELIVIDNAGHFNAKSGFNEFPQLVDKILELVK